MAVPIQPHPSILLGCRLDFPHPMRDPDKNRESGSFSPLACDERTARRALEDPAVFRGRAEGRQETRRILASEAIRHRE